MPRCPLGGHRPGQILLNPRDGMTSDLTQSLDDGSVIGPVGVHQLQRRRSIRSSCRPTRTTSATMKSGRPLASSYTRPRYSPIEPEEEQLDSGEERDRDDERREARRGGVAVCETFVDRIGRVHRCEGGRRRAPTSQAARSGVTEKANSPSNARRGAFAARRLAACPGLTSDRDSGLLEAHPGAEAPDVPVPLRQLIDLVDDAAGHQCEVARVDGHLDLGQSPHESIEDV